MALNSFSISSNATISAAGGTPIAFSTDGLTVQNGIHVIDPAIIDYRVQTNITFRNRRPVYKNGKWSKDKKQEVLVEPILLADGTIEYNLIRIEREIHPETPAAVALNFNTRAAQTLTGASFSSFWATGSTL